MSGESKKQRRNNIRRRRSQQKGRGIVGDYLKDELGDVAGTVAPMFVNAGVAEGRNLACKGFRYLKNKLARRQRATQTTTIDSASTQPEFTYDV